MAEPANLAPLLKLSDFDFTWLHSGDTDDPHDLIKVIDQHRAEIDAQRASRAEAEQRLAEHRHFVKVSRCPHPENARTGGNDYIECTQCGLMWDYRRETTGHAEDRLFARLAAEGEGEK